MIKKCFVITRCVDWGTGGLNSYQYSLNPNQIVDPRGLQVCYVAFPDMPIQTDTWVGETTWIGGHAGVLDYNNKGITRYYEYGRHSPNVPGLIARKGDNGNIRKVGMPNLVMGEDGKPTEDSMKKLQAELAKKRARDVVGVFLERNE